MIRLPRFRYHRAASVADAAAVLAGEGPGAMLLAGGTDLVPNLKRRQQTPAVVIGIRHLAELRGSSNGRGLALGAALRLAEVAADPRVQARYTALAQAAALVATPHLRTMGTLGGNVCLDTRCNYYDQSLEWREAIDFCMKAPRATGGTACAAATGDAVCWVAPSSPRCWAVSSTDTAPALVALGARCTLVSAPGEREIALEDLYADDGMAYLTKRPDEVLTVLRLPPLGEAWRSTYWKLRRRGSFDFPVLGVAAALRFGNGDVVEEARVVLGAVASRPLVVPQAADLVGRALTDAVIRDFARSAADLAKPMDNTDFTLSWRKKVAASYVAGALKELRDSNVRG
jgi:4-hydroxybenzoyl-CoA reductase subunit beta